MTIPFKTLKQKWMKDPEFVAEYERIGPEMELAMDMAEARRDAELSQAQLAKRMKTTQSAIARLESGRMPPKWGTLQRYAQAVGKRVVVHLEAIGAQAVRSVKAFPVHAPVPSTKKVAAKGPQRAKAAALKPKKAAALKPKAAKRRSGKRA